jgi:opacity protein-like surface antigen
MHITKRTKMNSSCGLAAAGATLFLGASHGQAQVADHLYFGVEGGAAFQQDTSILDNTGFGGSGGKISFAAGGHVGVDIGYRFSDYIAVELDPGVILNSITAVGSSDDPLPSGASANLDEIPILVNGIFTYPLGNFRPYAGVGFGAAIGVFESSNIPGSAFPPNFTYDDTDVTFAYQFQLGCKYALSKNFDVGVAYKFLGTTDHSWTANNINLKTDGTATHILEATLTWRF